MANTRTPTNAQEINQTLDFIQSTYLNSLSIPTTDAARQKAIANYLSQANQIKEWRKLPYFSNAALDAKANQLINDLSEKASAISKTIVGEEKSTAPVKQPLEVKQQSPDEKQPDEHLRLDSPPQTMAAPQKLPAKKPGLWGKQQSGPTTQSTSMPAASLSAAPK
jgi:hypothetical protein